MATQDDLDRAAAWANAQVGKNYNLGSFGGSFDCSTFMSGIATMIRDGVARRWFTTHPFHSGSHSPLAGWERNLQAPFMIGITAAGIGHTGGTLLGVEYEATPPRVRSGSAARGAHDSMYWYRYGFRPSLLDGEPGQPSAYPFMVGSTFPDARPLQRALKAVGLMPEDVEEHPNYGPQTQAAVIRFHDRYTEFRSGDGDDPQIGHEGWAFLKELAEKPTAPPEVPSPGPGESPDGYEVHLVVSGDTLNDLADEYETTVEEFVELNDIDDPDLITVGQGLKIPGTKKEDDEETPSVPYDGPWDATQSWPHVLVVQKALAREVGLDYSSGPGYYGPLTTAAWTRWQERLGFFGDDADGKPGRVSLPELARKYGFEVTGAPVS